MKKGLKFSYVDNQGHIEWNTELSPKIDNWFKKLNSETRFNGNVLVAVHGKVIYSNSCGYANYENKDTLSLENSFQIGSLSKPFTALAIMMLKERGLLNYDDDVKKYLIHFPYSGITIRHLLGHRSGLANYNYFCDEYTDRETIIYNDDVLRLICDSIPAIYDPPNTRFDYCNTNYVLLASIVEKVSKTPFETFMKKEIFYKAGMLNTKIMVNGKTRRLYKAALGYHYKWLKAPLTYQDGVIGDKGIYTTVFDLWKWNQALDSNIFVKKETLEEAFQPAVIEGRENKLYGLGWRLKTNIDGSKLVYHGGWWRGFNALFVKDLKNDAVYIMLCNVRTRAIFYYLRELMGIVDPVRHKMQDQADSLYLNQFKTIDSVKTDTDF
ncbi:MAG: serine hydrolase domain-containing protein [Bacteroidales bacterium]